MLAMQKSERQIANISIGNTQQVWKMLGAALYTERPLFPITIRELIQNSIDAQYANNVDTPLELNISYDEKHIIVEFVDHGIGMDEDTILNKFLALGESGKSNSSSVGGFGIAKASIIGSCHSWELQTRDNYLDSSMLGVCAILKTDFFDGCKITLKYLQNETYKPLQLDYDFLSKAMEYVATSNIKLILSIKDNDVDKKFVFDGLQGNPKLFVSEMKTDHYCAKIYLEPTIKIKYPTLYNDSVGCSTTHDVNGYLIYRIQGLTQFTDYTVNGDFNIIVDIKPFVGASDENYPLTSSRENINYSFLSPLQNIIKKYKKNPITTLNLINDILAKKTEQKIKYYDGATFMVEPSLINDQENDVFEQVETENEENLLLAETISVIEDTLQSYPKLDTIFIKTKPEPQPKIEKVIVTEASLKTTIVQKEKKSPYTFQMCIKYDEAKDLKKLTQPKYVKILRVWAELIQKLMLASPSFGSQFAIGFIMSDHVEAERFYSLQDSTVYYLVNPMKLKISEGLNTILKLLQASTHELAHAKHCWHDENFTVGYHGLYNAFLKKFGIKTLKKLNKLLLTGN